MSNFANLQNEFKKLQAEIQVELRQRVYNYSKNPFKRIEFLLSYVKKEDVYHFDVDAMYSVRAFIYEREALKLIRKITSEQLLIKENQTWFIC